jgi:hypothetical protein
VTNNHCLYHFTTERNAELIRTNGCAPSSLAVPGGGQAKSSVVSLTVNPDPSAMIGKSLGDGKPLSGRLLAAWRAVNPLVPAGFVPISVFTAEARIQYSIPGTDSLLVRFTKANAKRLGFNACAFDKFLSEGGGKIGEWWVYTGSLPTKYITEIRVPYPKYDRSI